MRVVVTGGLGYIGSHTCVELAREGHRLRIVDNLANAKPSVLERIRELAPGAEVEFVRADVRDAAALAGMFAGAGIEAVVHFAGLKSVRESVANPALYFDNNVGGTVALLQAMARHGVDRLVFSSSATVYGAPERLPYTENHRLQPMNPYGESKLKVERLLAGHAHARGSFLHASLRYFNPIGAHPSGRMGEDPRGVPENLFPYLTQVALGRMPRLPIFGGDYATPDGTGVRDYIHVMDLASGHLAALRYLADRKRSITVNLGTGRGWNKPRHSFVYGGARPDFEPSTYKERTMKRTLLAASLAFAATGTTFAGPAADAAKLHFQTIGSGDTILLARGYADNAQLHWIGGPLDGTYTGLDSIRGVWEKFTKAQGPLKVSVDKLEESANPKGTTVTANVQFEGKQPIKVRYVLTYRDGKLVAEIWQIDPKLTVSGS